MIASRLERLFIPEKTYKGGPAPLPETFNLMCVTSLPKTRALKTQYLFQVYFFTTSPVIQVSQSGCFMDILGWCNHCD